MGEGDSFTLRRIADVANGMLRLTIRMTAAGVGGL